MSNYAAAVLAKGQAIVTDKYQAPEQRKKNPTVLELALKNQHISIPDAQALRLSPLRPVEVNYLTSVAPGTATAKAYNHTGTFGDSGSVQLVYVSHVETIGLPRKLAANNKFTYEQMFANQYEEKWKNLKVRHDTSALAFLLANRCQLTSSVITPATASANAGTWSDTNFALEVAQADKGLMLQRIKTFMAARYFTGDLDIVTDLQLMSAFMNYMNQGAGNQANTSWQFDGANFTPTQDVVDAAYNLGATFALPAGLFAGLNWNEALNRKGVNEDYGGPVGILTTVDDPMGSGATADLSMYTQRADTSSNSTGGSTEDIVDQWELTLTIGYALPPLSLTGDSVVHLFGQV